MVAQFSILNRTGFWSNFTFRSKLHKNPRCAPYLLSPTKMNIVGFHNEEVSPLAIRKTDPCWIMRHAWCHPRVNVIHPLDIAKHYSNIPKQIIIFHCKNTKLWPWVENKFIDWLACLQANTSLYWGKCAMHVTYIFTNPEEYWIRILSISYDQ